MQQQPFCLSYRDAADRQWNYTVLHAKITFREKRQYLDCWCEESEGNQDLPALIHNWSLRLDRITEASVASIDRKWKNDLDKIEVVLHLQGGLAFSYERKPDDSDVIWLDTEPPIRQVKRMVSNTFWLMREILPYRSQCQVISPEGVRTRLKQELNSWRELYNLAD
nr:WYL domain-containing protein [Iningainema tapete]